MNLPFTFRPQTMGLSWLLLWLLLIGHLNMLAQIRINEASNANFFQISDEDADFNDWIELYNSSNTNTVNLNGYHLSDDAAQLDKWPLPNLNLPPHSHLLVFASGKDRRMSGNVNHWEMAFSDTDAWRYTVPNNYTSAEWKSLYFDDSMWANGPCSVGYGDGDDQSIVPDGTVSVYLRRYFEVADTTAIAQLLLAMDYDDGFVAYLNGVEIARNGLIGTPPPYNALASIDHEAQLYAGQTPEVFPVNPAALRQGTNVIAVEVHNTSLSSSDLSAHPFLLVGLGNENNYFSNTPTWFVTPEGSTSYLHTNFKISSEGETLFLSNSNGMLADSMTVISLDSGHSIGRNGDGGATVGIFEQPTPNATNNTSVAYMGYCPTPVFSIPSGQYSTPQLLTITTADPFIQIRFSTDGNTPQSSSPLYSQTLALNNSQIVKARCFRSGFLPGKTNVQTYLINEDFSLPVLSLSTDVDNLYGPTGIYDNWGEDWKRQAYIEYFDENGTRQFAQRTAIRIDGGWGGSRSHPQKSFRLEFSDDAYGDGAVDYALIPDKPNLDEYATIYLRNGSNEWNTQPYRDACQQRMSSRNTDNVYSAYRPVVVYLNGQYWGVYEMREKVDKHYLQYNYQADKDSVDILSVGSWYGLDWLRIVEGSDTGFYNLHAFVTTADPWADNYLDEVGSRLNINNFIDYMCAETWHANGDWLYNNMRLFRSHTTDNLWHFCLHDLELGWNNLGHNTLAYLMYEMAYTPYSQIFNALIENPAFRTRFINRYADIMNDPLRFDHAKGHLHSMHSELMPEMTRQWERWGWMTVAEHLAEYNNRRDWTEDFLENRSDIVRNDMEALFGLPGQTVVRLAVNPPQAGRIQISTLTPDDYPWEGVYFQGVPIKITAFPNTGYSFAGWEGNFSIDSPNTSELIMNANDIYRTLTANFTEGSNSSSQIIISEINYNAENSIESGDWVELYNAGDAPANLGGWIMKDSNDANQYSLPNITLNPQERFVLVNDPLAFVAQYPTVTNYAGAFAFSLNNTADQVRLFDNLNNLIAAVAYIDSIPWPRGADGEGRTLELKDPTLALGNPSNWFDGCIGGSPGQPYTPCTEPVIFAEINYNSDALTDSDDWVELKNQTDAPINLSGWTFKDSQDTGGYVFPNGTLLPANGRLVLAQTAAKFACLYPDVPFIGSFGFNLSGSGEVIRLYDNAARIKHSVHFDDNPDYGWPTLSDGGGHTLELLDDQQPLNNGNNWFAGCIAGSPSIAYNAACPTLTALPPALAGPTTTCKNQPYTYTVPAVAGATYLWTVTPNGTIISGQGTNSIQVNWSSAGSGTVNVSVTTP